ncbi:MAG TPA: nodulation protein NfeD, partial [Anaerolineae bacterium]|nr:nodulation protein NfeD [Anaerolineae bacterium]
MRWPRFLFIAITVLSLAHSAAARGGPHVNVVEVEGPITPITLSYIRRGIEVAENDGAVCLIVQLDTPGGLLTVTRDIVQEIRVSRVPVVVYVAPRGAAAASAGTLIALAGHAA